MTSGQTAKPPAHPFARDFRRQRSADGDGRAGSARRAAAARRRARHGFPGPEDPQGSSGGGGRRPARKICPAGPMPSVLCAPMPAIWGWMPTEMVERYKQRDFRPRRRTYPDESAPMPGRTAPSAAWLARSWPALWCCRGLWRLASAVGQRHPRPQVPPPPPSLRRRNSRAAPKPVDRCRPPHRPQTRCPSRHRQLRRPSMLHAARRPAPATQAALPLAPRCRARRQHGVAAHTHRPRPARHCRSAQRSRPPCRRVYGQNNRKPGWFSKPRPIPIYGARQERHGLSSTAI